MIDDHAAPHHSTFYRLHDFLIPSQLSQSTEEREICIKEISIICVF